MKFIFFSLTVVLVSLSLAEAARGGLRGVLRIDGTNRASYKVKCTDDQGFFKEFIGRVPGEHVFFGKRPYKECVVQKRSYAGTLSISYEHERLVEGLVETVSLVKDLELTEAFRKTHLQLASKMPPSKEESLEKELAE